MFEYNFDIQTCDTSTFDRLSKSSTFCGTSSQSHANNRINSYYAENTNHGTDILVTNHTRGKKN